VFLCRSFWRRRKETLQEPERRRSERVGGRSWLGVGWRKGRKPRAAARLFTAVLWRGTRSGSLALHSTVPPPSKPGGPPLGAHIERRPRRSTCDRRHHKALSSARSARSVLETRARSTLLLGGLVPAPVKFGRRPRERAARSARAPLAIGRPRDDAAGVGAVDPDAPQRSNGIGPLEAHEQDAVAVW